MYFPDRVCVHTLLILYVYATEEDSVGCNCSVVDGGGLASR